MLKFFKSPRTIKPLSHKSIRNLILWGTLALTINSVHAMDPEEKKSSYALGTGKKAAERLDLQDKFLAALTRRQLEKAGLSPGQTVYELGSGSGVVTEVLAEGVGVTGHVRAVDNSEKQLDIAKKKLSLKGLNNVTFVRGDAQSLEGLPTEDADLVYIRFLLLHVQNPKAVIEGAKKLLKPGGVLVLQEPIMSSSIYKNLPGYIEKLAAVAAHKHVDYDIGNRLASLCQEAGFSCTVEEHRPVLTPLQAKAVHLMGIAEWKDEAIKDGILQQSQVDEWVRIINSWPEESDTTSFYTAPTNVYVIATKKD